MNLSDMIDLVPWIALITAVSIGGWVLTTWLRIKHGYPLENSWGMAIHPKTDRESLERIKLLTNENAQRIVTDKPSKLAREIEALAIDNGGHA